MEYFVAGDEAENCGNQWPFFWASELFLPVYFKTDFSGLAQAEAFLETEYYKICHQEHKHLFES